MRKLELQDGSTVNLTLNFKHLYTLRVQRPEVYKEYYKAVNEIGSQGSKDNIFPCIQAIYTAYLCGAIEEDKLADAMGYTDFLELLPENTVEIILLGNDLLSPNRRGGSAARSSRRQKTESGEKE